MARVGIIGAGPSGLCAAHHILNTPGLEPPVVWERTGQLGGTWRLSEQIGRDSRGLPVHSSMYHGLRTDLPTVLMAFPDYPFPEDTEESFVHHTVVLKYLEDYARHYQLLPHIKFGHEVESVCPVVKQEEGPPTWRVTSRDLQSGTLTTTTCDALLVCNGHFSEPNFTKIEGLEKYEGEKLHSHDYRHPHPFTGVSVLVVGAGASGLDIALELSSVASQVLLSHNYPVQLPSDFPPNLHQMSRVSRATQHGFTFSDGTHAEAQAVIFCTGYKYSFPFLSQECEVSVKDNHIRPLYKHLIYAKFPSLGFIGIPQRIVVFPLVDYQVRYFLAIVMGKVCVPSYDNMMAIIEEEEREMKAAGEPDKYYHIFGPKQFQYMEGLAQEAGLKKPPGFYEKLFTIVIVRLFFSFPIFKTYNYSLTPDGSSIVEARHRVSINTTRDLTLLVVRQLVCLLWRDFRRVVWLLGSIMVKKIGNIFKFG
ncbi:hypothetical protein Pmani_037519 [Petrolisthes manimaculis]|uniref:Flavin-containing monooxygenase n=1 Tax=Petrolisthes manimaculis TaxID=1843537 RepID=A0AAE1NGL5_9EUCA|nr:hypothetical protein Pmani_037519 [Petrolisthes manimaculis]